MARARVIGMAMAGRGSFAGGMGRCAGNLSTEIARRAPGVVFRHIDTRGSGSLVLAPLFLARALAGIALLAVTGRLPLLHVHLSAHGSAARKLMLVGLAKALRVPVLLHLHGSRFDSFWRALPPWPRRMVRWMFLRADHVVVLGESWRRLVVEEVGVPPGRVEVIHNGVPARPRAAPQEGVPHLLILGQLGARKGVPELLSALASPVLADLPWRATLAGGGDLAGTAAQLQRLGLAERVALPGWVDEARVAQLLAGASLLVLPSHAENLPMAVIEGLAAGLPVVTTPVGAIPEFLEDGRSALLVPPGDAEALARALARLLTDPSLRAAIAAGGSEVFARHFDIDVVARRMAAAYRRLGALDEAPAAPHPRSGEGRERCGPA